MEEDQHGTYFLNSYDMNMLGYIDKLIEAGVDSLKIEGRAKSVYYLSTVVKAYRKVIDNCKNKKKFEEALKEGRKELNNLIHRGYWTGFLLGDQPPHNIHSDNFKSNYKFVGEVEGVKNKFHPVKFSGASLPATKFNRVNIVYLHNEIFIKDKLEAITPEKIFPIKIKKIYNHNMEQVKEAHGGHKKRYFFEFDKILPNRALIRKKL